MRPPDPRNRLQLGGVADLALEGVAEAERFVRPQAMQAAAPDTLIRRAPDAGAEALDQLLFGERFDVLERRDAWGFGQARRDGYVGWAPLDALAAPGLSPTHWVCAPATHVYSEPSIRSVPLARLVMNSLVRTRAGEGTWVEVEGLGLAPAAHLRPLGGWADDPAAVAARFLHTPYLWGGRGAGGIDCSGLVQQAFAACGVALPRDSDQQAALGREVEAGALRRGDLVFWPGHVAMALEGGGTLLHANAFHMAVAAEPLVDALARIGAPSACRRVWREDRA